MCKFTFRMTENSKTISHISSEYLEIFLGQQVQQHVFSTLQTENKRGRYVNDHKQHFNS